MKLNRTLLLVLGLTLGLTTIWLGGCRRGIKAPEPSSSEYRAIVSAFYVGLAALQVGDDQRADEKLKLATELAPGEPAAWADWGLLALRRREFDAAAERFEKARSQVPDNSRINFLLGLLDSNRGKSPDAIVHLRRAVELNPKDLKALYLLASETERAGGENSNSTAQVVLEKILEVQPDNIAALLDTSRLAAKRGDSESLQKSLARLRERATSWSVESRKQLDVLNLAARGSDLNQAATQVAFLRNVLLRETDFRKSLAAVKTPPEILAEPFTSFITLPSPSSSPALPDGQLRFTTQPITEMGPTPRDWCGAISLLSDGTPTVICADARELTIAGGVTLSFPGGPASANPHNGPGPNGVLGLDYNYDFKTDLALAGAGGFRLFKQGDEGAFVDVTVQTTLQSSITKGSFIGAHAADIDSDGDLDIVLEASKGLPKVLRNNGDGTFVEIHPFNLVDGLLDFAWADLDSDGDADAALIDGSGMLRLFINERQGKFLERSVSSNSLSVRAINIADVNNDGALDLIVVRDDGRLIVRISDKYEGREWETAEIVRSTTAPTYGKEPLHLLVADLDNNGGLDLLLNGKCGECAGSVSLWLSDENGALNPLEWSGGGAPQIFGAADINGDGLLDLVGVSSDGHPIVVINTGSKNYHWQVLRPRAQETAGDQRVNSFGIGGEIEIRAGLLTSRQVINGAQVHFGLGNHEQTDVARVIWPNGVPHAEFELKADQVVLAEQRLKGSCPSLFAFDGKEIRFVKDCAPWSPAIGLRINSYQTAEVSQTEEWVKIRGDQLEPRDGFYDLRITAELWETYYLDHYELLTVDHPMGTEVFVDERTARVKPKLTVYTVSTPQPFVRASDEQGKDVTDVISLRDGKYLDTFGRGDHQGITRDHYVELVLDEDAPRTGQLLLIAHGWLLPTDASINVAYSQGKNEAPHDLSLEVQDEKGRWSVSQRHLGFPSGKNKTIIVDLTNVFGRAAPRRLRLRTNMEIYWDAIEWAVGRPDVHIETVRLSPASAELRFRGFSEMGRENRSSPETPSYNRIDDTTQRWRDLTGYYTRYGDVRDLLALVDDRYVIANAGDELLLRFAALAPTNDGSLRDYVLIGNGWIKDGDYNSMFSQTVLPLPERAKTSYKTLPARLEDDPVYRRHWKDWQDYHTRYVTSESFQNGLKLSK